MPEPASTGVAGAAAAYKAIGGAAAAAAGGATLAAVVVMLMTPPRSFREWAVGLISTVVSSIGGGAIVIEHFQLHADAARFTAQQEFGVGKGQAVGVGLQHVAQIGMGLQVGPGIGQAGFVEVLHVFHGRIVVRIQGGLARR